jgi:uncharacterized protein YdeI (YjbR/CyaY-like superfamily)
MSDVGVPENSVECTERGQWREWLCANYDNSTGVWLITHKKNSPQPTLSYEDAVEEALCFGWVDSRPRKLDECRTMLYFAPRKAGSGWARPNKIRVERLIQQGLMHPAGLAKVEKARKDGTWSMLDAVEDLVVPEDLAADFESFPPAAANFAAFPRSVQRGILEWIVQAKRAETRSARIRTTAEMAQRNERANQWRK